MKNRKSGCLVHIYTIVIIIQLMENLRIIAMVFVAAILSTVTTEVALAYNKTLAIENTNEIFKVIDDALAIVKNHSGTANVSVQTGLGIPMNASIEL